jgi:dTDP-4-amino-4,6-dideoxygalactose transaminase
MDGIQGAALKIKLKHLDKWNALRVKHADRYRQLLTNVPGVLLPKACANRTHVYHIFAVRIKNRDEVLKKMGERGIACGIHYPIPVHLQDAYKFLGQGRGSFPVAEQCADEFLSLPMFPELTEEQIQAVATELRNCVAGNKQHAAVA